MRSNIYSSPTHQRGVILIITLILLVVLTIIGVAGVRSSVLQENMTGNMRESMLAFQAAEVALRTGEEDVIARYQNNTLSNLEAQAISGTNSKLTGVAKAPSYKLSLAANIKTSTEAGVPVDDEGMLVLIQGEGAGVASAGNNAISSASLQSTYLVEK